MRRCRHGPMPGWWWGSMLRNGARWPASVSPWTSAATVTAPGVAVADRGRCVGCGRCTIVCPTGAIGLDGEGKATVNRAICHGCGACVQECRTGAMRLETLRQPGQKQETAR
jgi:NAD-dependent dihydropyrimidine dehydrogenase PreA subunit